MHTFLDHLNYGKTNIKCVFKNIFNLLSDDDDSKSQDKIDEGERRKHAMTFNL